jgi:hypothetical protein
MWNYIGVILINLFSSSDSIQRNHANLDPAIDFQVGDKFSELSEDSQELLHKSTNFDVEMTDPGERRWAQNTDDCFVYNNDCQPDYTHHVFKVAMNDHKGYFYTITFSYNWRILNIENGYSHG